MRQYIVSLTDQLINSGRYDVIFKRISDNEIFLEHVDLDLLAGAVAKMNPGTLGKIVCSFESEDLMLSKEEIFDGITFVGSCEEMLRELVSFLLAHVILNRLYASPGRINSVSVYLPPLSRCT